MLTLYVVALSFFVLVTIWNLRKMKARRITLLARCARSRAVSSERGEAITIILIFSALISWASIEYAEYRHGQPKVIGEITVTQEGRAIYKAEE